MLFSQQLGEMQTKYKDLLANVPENLTSQFKDRMTKSVAVEMSRKRAELGQNAIFPPMDDQTKMQQELEETQKLEKGRHQKRKAPVCKKCQKPRLGHAKNSCPP